jgi:hypothetical protein
MKPLKIVGATLFLVPYSISTSSSSSAHLHLLIFTLLTSPHLTTISSCIVKSWPSHVQSDCRATTCVAQHKSDTQLKVALLGGVRVKNAIALVPDRPS